MNCLKALVAAVIVFAVVSAQQGSAYGATTSSVQQPGNSPLDALELTSGRYFFDYTKSIHWFKIGAQTGQTVSVTVTLQDNVVANLMLYSPAVDPAASVGLVASTSRSDAGGVRSVTYLADKPGFYYVKLEGFRLNEVVSSYELKIFLSEFKASSAYWGDGATKVSAAPGDLAVPLTVTLDHRANYTITGLSATLILPKWLSGVVKTNEASASTGSQLDPGKTVSLLYTLNISPDAKIGVHTLTAVVDYHVKIGSNTVHAIPVEVSVEIPLLGRADIAVSASQEGLVTGAKNDLALVFANLGDGAASSFEASITASSGVSLLGGGSQVTIKTIPPRGNISHGLVIDVAENAPTSIQMSISMSYRDPYGNVWSRSRVVGLRATAPESERVDVSTTQKELLSGTVNNFKLQFSNRGNSPIRDLEVTSSAPAGAVIIGEGAKSFIRSLGAGEDVEVPLSIYVPVSNAGGAAQLQVSFSYYNSRGSLQSSSRSLGFVVKPFESPVLDIEVDSVSIISGLVNSITVAVRNVGDSAAADVKVELSPPSSVVLLGSGLFSYPGIPAKGIVRFTLPVYLSPSSATQVVQIPAAISYRDEQGSVRTSNKVLGLKSGVSTGGMLSVSQNVDSVVQETFSDVAITITNGYNRPIYNLTTTVSASAPAAVLSGARQTRIGAVNPGEKVSLPLRVFVPKGQSPSSIQLQVASTYVDNQQTSRSESDVVSFAVKGFVSPLGVTTNSTFLSAGLLNRPSIVIRNTGDKPVISVEVVLSSSSSSGAEALSISSGSDRWLMDEIGARSEKALKPEVFASLGSKDTLKELKMTLRYLDASGSWHEDPKSLIFTVRGTIEVIFQSQQVSPASGGQGGNFTVTGTIINKGNSDAMYSTVGLKTNQGFRSSLTNGQYLGNIPPNTPLPFSIPVTAERTIAEGSYQLAVRVSYEDSYGAKNSVEVTIPVTITRASANPRSTAGAQQATSASTDVILLFYGLLGAIVVGGSLAVLKVKRGAAKVRGV
ncbi:MAG: hypothetical protein HYU39_05275 [Thaumarchaeota archaeon]|nr:hypothetical protein [Nitrososphaerota archaeon]